MQIESGDMRAYTYVDFALARVGNRWMERVFTRFLGTTSELLQKTPEQHWVKSQPDEAGLSLNGEHVTHFEDVEISEECDGFGATLVVSRRLPELEVIHRVTALHDNPAMRRIVSIKNLSTEPAMLTEVCIEKLSWDTPEPPRLIESVRPGQLEIPSEISISAATCGDAGMLVGLESRGPERRAAMGGAVLEVIDTATYSLAPGATVELTPLFLIPFQGTPEDAAESFVPGFLRRVRQQDSQAAARDDTADPS